MGHGELLSVSLNSTDNKFCMGMHFNEGDEIKKIENAFAGDEKNKNKNIAGLILF